MKIIIYLLLVISNYCFSQDSISTRLSVFEVDKIANYVKIWGFLKFYHPNVAKGQFDWDEEFMSNLKLVNTAINKDELSEVYRNWLKRIGPIKEYKERQNLKVEYFTENLDLSWINENLFFDTEVSKLLKDIKINRFQGDSYYIKKGKNGNVEITNEGVSKFNGLPNLEERLLYLCKYWNSVEYFYPYKYLADVDWEDVLKEMIQKFYLVENEIDFDLLMLETVVKTDDGHGVFKTKNTIKYFGDLFFPANIKLISSEAVVSSIPNDSIGKLNDLRIGDVVKEINGEKINDIIHRKYKYLHGSNQTAKLRDTYYFLTNGSSDSVNIKILRSNVLLDKNIRRYNYDFIHGILNEKKKFRILDNNIGYINMESLNIKDVNIVMDKLMDTKGLIIDLRNYPKFIPYQLAGRFVKNEVEAIKILVPDLTYPGRFVFEKPITVKPVKKYYDKKVVLLVNENTQSRAEFCAMLFQASPNVITVGSKTAGANGNVTFFNFSSQNKSLISGTGVYYSDNKVSQRNGVKIDVKVEPTLLGIQELRDEQFLKAIDVLNTTSKF